MENNITWYAAAKFIRELGDKVVIYPVLEWAENDHRPRVADRQLLHRLVRQHVLILTCETITHIPPLTVRW